MYALCTPPVTVSVYSDKTFGCMPSDVSRNTIPFFRFDAPSRVITPIFPSGVTLTSFTSRASTFNGSALCRWAGSAISNTYTLSLIAERYA